MKHLLIALTIFAMPLSSSVLAATTAPPKPTIGDLQSACPAGDDAIRQSAFNNLLTLGDEQIRNGFPDAGLLQLDRVLRLTAKAKSPAATQATLNALMTRPLWEMAVSPQRPDRMQRLEQLTQLANQSPDPLVRAQTLLKIAREYQASNSMPMALKTIEPVPGLLKDLKLLDNSFALLLETAELYAQLQPDRSRKLLNQVVEKLRSIEPEIPPDDRKFVLNPHYASITRVYALLGQPQLAETFAKRMIFSSNIPANEISAIEVQAKVRLQVSLAITYANAKQQVKADRIMTQTLNSTNDASILIDALLQYAKGRQWMAVTQATALIKDPQTKFRARLDLGALADQQGRPDRAIELGKLAAQHAREASSFSIGRDDVIQWLGSWLSSETSTNALLPVIESLELYVYDDLVDGVLRVAIKNRQESVIKQALVWADQKAQPHTPPEAILIYADRNQPDAAIRSALRAKNPYGQLAALASYYQRMQQPRNIAKVKQAASGRLAVETFGDVKQITEVNTAMSAIDVSSGKQSAAKISLRQSLQNAKKKLSKDAYFALTRELANQLLFYGQPELMAIVIAEVPKDRQAVIKETLDMGKTFSGQFSLRHSSIDRVLRGLILTMDSTPDEKVRALMTTADSQVHKNQMNEAELTIQSAVNLVPKISPDIRNYMVPMLVHTIVKTNRSELLLPVITTIPDTNMLQYTRQFAGCSL
jgi:hypothetical protein